MLDILCALPLSSEAFTQALHPTEPLLSVGLATGHVQTYRLPTDDDKNAATTTSTTTSSSSDDDDDTASTSRPRRSSLSSHSSPTPLITTSWRTRRHHGSCRALAFSAVDGRYLFSAGTDGLVKLADSSTGRVVAKIAAPATSSSSRSSGSLDFPCAIHPLTPEAFLLATDSGKVHLYDTRTNGKDASTSLIGRKPVRSWTPHVAGECVSSFVSVPPSETSTSGLPRAFITTGGGGVALTDIRKGNVVGASLEAPEPINASAMSSPSGHLVVGDAAGGVWSMNRSLVARWEDGIGRNRVDIKRTIKSPEGDVLDVSGAIDTDAGIEVMCSVPEGEVGNRVGRDAVVLGWDTGRVEIVALQGKGGKGGSKAGSGVGGGWATRGDVVLDLPPDAEGEGIVGLGFDSAGRLVAAAGQKIVIYEHSTSAGSGSTRAGDRDGDGEDDSGDDSDHEAGSTAAMNGAASASSSAAQAVSARGHSSSSSSNKRPAENHEHDDDDDDVDEEDNDDRDDEEDKGQDNSSDEEEEDQKQRRRPKKKKKKRKGKQQQQQNHASFNFAGLD